ncbi:MAG: ATP-dependent Clp protease ATP-binding subunit [Flavobacteriaceae bacterium]|nr:ATP-dependent Clp protease ATP-binding subunit [Flavobacteriaceae bacterium]
MLEDIDKVIHIAKQIAKEHHHANFSPSHLIKALLHKDFGLLRYLHNLDVDVYYIDEWAEVHVENYPKSSKSSITIESDKGVNAILEEAVSIADRLEGDHVDLLSVFIAAITPGVGFSYDQLKTLPITHTTLLEQTAVSSGSSKTASDILPPALHKKNSDALSSYCINKIDQVKEDIYKNIFNRDKELKLMAEILSRKSKPHVILSGESGVGKTALINKFIHLVYNNKLLTQLELVNFYELNIPSLFAGASYKGEVEDRLQAIFSGLKAFEKPIFFIDDIHILFDSDTASANTANLIKDELSKGDITFIGTTSIDGYRKNIASDNTIERRFQPVVLDEPVFDLCFRIVKSVAEEYESHHQLSISDNTIKESIRLAKRYLKDKSLPDSAIDLLDRTMAAVTISNQSLESDLEIFKNRLSKIEKEIDKEDDLIKELDWLYTDIKNTLSLLVLEKVEQTGFPTGADSKVKKKHISDFLNRLETISKESKDKLSQEDVATMVSVITGIPAGKVKVEERDRLLQIEETLKKRVIGQDLAIKSVADAIVESRSGLSKAGQPIGSFFFSGPTGTGKTELAKALAEFLFGDETAIIRFDMSEFKEEHSAALLYGAPPGYVGYEEGGVLVNKIRQKPYAIVLFDEIEKAHQSVFDVFLQILDEGTIHDRLGKEGDFSNAVILFTSNIGSEYIISSTEKNILPSTNELLDIMSNYFRPEFLGRLTEIVPFLPITEKYVPQIFELHLKKELLNLTKKLGFDLVLTDKVKKYLALKGFSPKYGVRPLKAIIRSELKKPLAKMIVSNKVPKSKTINIILKNDKLVFN